MSEDLILTDRKSAQCMTDTNLKKLGIPLGIPRADLDSLESAAPCTDSQGAAGILCMAETTYSRNLAAELQPQPTMLMPCEMPPCGMGRRDAPQRQGARFGTTAPTSTPEAGATNHNLNDKANSSSPTSRRARLRHEGHCSRRRHQRDITGT